jgi:hypothetical protein
VLSVTAEPPEVKPGQSSSLAVLQLDPSRPGGKTTVIWVGCEPDPTGDNYTACNDTSALLQPTMLTTFPEGVRILGIGNKAAYASQPTLFDDPTLADAIRLNGVVGPVLAVVIGEEIDPTSTNEELKELFQRIETQQVKSVYALSRITVSLNDAPNQNPYLEGLTVDGEPLPKNATVQVAPGQQRTLHVEAGERETYTLQLPEGPAERTETLVAAWYSSGGRFSRERLTVGEHDAVFTAPGAVNVPEDPVPQKRLGNLWLVLRDGRGGQAFQQVPFFVCDDSLPDPKPTEVIAPASRSDPVTVKGTDLSSALDVVVGGIALVRGFYSPAQNAFLGDVPPELPSGVYPVSVRTKKCTRFETALTLVVP